MELVQLVGQPEHGIENAVRRRWHRLGSSKDGRDGARQTSVRRQQLLDVGPQRRGQGQQAHGLGGGCAIDDHRVPPVGHVLGDGPQGEQLLQPGNHRQLLGMEAFGSCPLEQLLEVGTNRRPRSVEELLGVDLLRAERRRHARRTRAQPAPEDVAERVRAVRRHHQGARTTIGRAERRGSGNRRLAGAALAGHEQDAWAHRAVAPSGHLSCPPHCKTEGRPGARVGRERSDSRRERRRRRAPPSCGTPTGSSATASPRPSPSSGAPTRCTGRTCPGSPATGRCSATPTRSRSHGTPRRTRRGSAAS